MAKERIVGGPHKPEPYVRTKTLPLGVPMVPLPAEPGEQVAAQVEAVIPVELPQKPVEHKPQASTQPAEPEKPANYPQYLEALAFVKSLFPQKSQEEAEEWVRKYVTIYQGGEVELRHSKNSIERLQAPIQFPQHLIISGNLIIWPNQQEIRIGRYTYVRGNLMIIGDSNIILPDSEDFYVDGNVSYSRTTPEAVVKKLQYFKKIGKIKGNLIQN